MYLESSPCAFGTHFFCPTRYKYMNFSITQLAFVDLYIKLCSSYPRYLEHVIPLFGLSSIYALVVCHSRLISVMLNQAHTTICHVLE